MLDESAAVTTTPAMPTPKKKAKGTGVKKGKVTPSHPKVSEMVNAAIASLKERGGSSLQAIKKYIGGQYKVDMDRLTPFLKKYLKSAVASGILVQTKGKGATGSFKLSATGQKANEPSKKIKKSLKREKNPTVVKKSKTNVQKKSVKPKVKSVGDKLKKKTIKKASSPAKKAMSKAKSPKKIAKPIKPKAKKLKTTTPKKAMKKTAKK